MSVEDFPTRVRRLADEQGTSMARVMHDAWDPQVRGTSPDLARKVLTGRRVLTPTLIEAFARALNVEPDEFPEYRLAQARLALDEREVGLDDALAALTVFEAALRESPTRRARRAHERALDAQQQKQEGRRGRATRRAT